jgi:hypothetical protein
MADEDEAEIKKTNGLKMKTTPRLIPKRPKTESWLKRPKRAEKGQKG